MSQADRIRQAALDLYVLPARKARRDQVVIRAGDLHSDMKLANALPAVCSALGGMKFESLAGVRKLDVTAPTNGANVYFRYEFYPLDHEKRPSPKVERLNRKTSHNIYISARKEGSDLHGALVLASCAKSKLPHRAAAQSLYCSTWFTKVRSLIESQGARWFLLSALYGLVRPNDVIEPYDHTLNTQGTVARRAWSEKVYQELKPELQNHNRVVFFAGQRYREFLIDPLLKDGINIDIPMQNLTLFEQLSWLSNQK